MGLNVSKKSQPSNENSSISSCGDKNIQISKKIAEYKQQIKSGNSLYVYKLAQLYEFDQKDYQKAEKTYLKAISLGCDLSLYNLALLYHYKLEKYDMARKYYLKAVSNIPFDKYKKYYNLAILCYLKIHDFKDAEYYCIRAIEKIYSTDALMLLMLINIDIISASNNDFDESEYYKEEMLTSKDKHLVILEFYRSHESDYEKIIRLYQIFHNHGKDLDLDEEESLADSCIQWKITGNKSNNRNFQILMSRMKLLTEEKCGICLETNNCVMFECCHTACTHCYVRVMSGKRICPFCRMKLNS